MEVLEGGESNVQPLSGHITSTFQNRHPMTRSGEKFNELRFTVGWVEVGPASVTRRTSLVGIRRTHSWVTHTSYSRRTYTYGTIIVVLARTHWQARISRHCFRKHGSQWRIRGVLCWFPFPLKNWLLYTLTCRVV